MKHLIFTNFGVGITDEVWLTYRLAIFQNTTLASIRAQTNKNFTWHIFIDKRLQSIYRIQLEKSIPGDIKTTLHEVDDYSKIVSVANQLAERKPGELLITSRIDDDDCICTTAIDEIQKAAINDLSSADYLIIALRNGIEYCLSDQVARHVENESIAICLSLVDRSSHTKPTIISSFAHHTIRETLRSQEKNATYIGISSENPLYIYNKHPLSDSFYVGARMRVLNDSKNFRPNETFLCNFGLSALNTDDLSRLTSDCPLGQPYKYLEKLTFVRKKIAETIKENESKKSQVFDQSSLDYFLALQKKLESNAVRPNPRSKVSNKIRVAIIGSCVTRDLFEFQSKLLSEFEICFYAARSSIVSTLAPPCTDVRMKISSDTFESRVALIDFEKSLWIKLRDSRPDIILVDLIDERIGLISYGGSWLTASGPIIKSLERLDIKFEIHRPWSQQVTRLRSWAAKRFIENVVNICPNILIHSAMWATEYIDKFGLIREFDTSETKTLINLNNQIIENTLREFDESLAPIDYIGGFETNCMRAGGDHKWSFSPFHYDSKYYSTVAKQLLSRVI